MDGVQTIVKLQGDELITGTSQNCDAILDDAKARHNEGMHGTREMKHAARLPLVVVETYCNVNGVSYAECMANPVHFRAMLNDPALSDFRIWPGAV